MEKKSSDDIRSQVRRHYAKVANNPPRECGSAGSACCRTENSQSARATGEALGYSKDDLSSGAAQGANMNLGCGNPVAMGSLRKGESVLDLGCGGGFDSFLAAKEVGREGRVIGVDMTADMVSKARKNADTMKAENVSFRLGEIEHLPVADASINVILSNCVINLSPDKKQVWQEAYRVLRPGGRLAISDVVATGEIPAGLKDRAVMLTGCVAGAERVEVLQSQLETAGFEKISIRLRPESRDLIRQWFPGSKAEKCIASADIEAIKPEISMVTLPENDDWILRVRHRAEENIRRYDNCTQSIVAAFLEVLNIHEPAVLRVSSGFFGGMTSSLTCGIHSAGIIIMGLLIGRNRLEEGPDGLFPLVKPTQKLLRRLNKLLGSHSCKELTGVDFTDLKQAIQFPASEEHDRCIARVADGAEEIARFINEKSKAGELFRPGTIR